jgi:hypothetical protein
MESLSPPAPPVTSRRQGLRALRLFGTVPALGWSLIAAGATAAVVLGLATALDWTGRTTLAVGAICAFVFSMIVGPLLFSRPRRSVALTRTSPEGSFLPSGETTEGVRPVVTMRKNGR